MNFCDEMVKQQEIWTTADEIYEGNSELFSNQFYRGRSYFAVG
jgi:hypothetical protein